MSLELVMENVSSILSFSLQSLLLQISNYLCISCLNFLQFFTVLLKRRQSSSSSIANSADKIVAAPLSFLCPCNQKDFAFTLKGD